MNKYIVLVGAAGAGKDSVAEFISKHFEFIPVSLTHPVRRVAADMFGVAYHESNWNKEAIHPYLKFADGGHMTNRNVLEQLSDKLQEIDPLVLVRDFERFTDKNFVITDTRTLIQTSYFKERGGIIVWVHNNVAEARADSCYGEDAHHTKTLYKRVKYDIRIDNNMSFDALEQEVVNKVGSIYNQLKRV
jgi:dephospho-CoA kinase